MLFSRLLRRSPERPFPFAARRRLMLELLEDRRVLAADWVAADVVNPVIEPDCGCGSRPAAESAEVAAAWSEASGLLLVGAAGEALPVDQSGDTLYVAAATWCGATVNFV